MDLSFIQLEIKSWNNTFIVIRYICAKYSNILMVE